MQKIIWSVFQNAIVLYFFFISIFVVVVVVGKETAESIVGVLFTTGKKK